VITLLCYLVDKLGHGAAVRTNATSEFPTGDRLSIILALLHLPMLGLAVWAIAGNASLAPHNRIGALIGFGLFFGQIGHPNAHELIHRSGRGLRRLGVMIYATLLMGHHVSAHRLVHHVHVGTPSDPNSAPKGIGFWRFALNAAVSSFIAGWRAEDVMRARSRHDRAHPYFIYISWSFAALILSFIIAGLPGVLSLIALATYAQIQVLLADYVQHYGLRRSVNHNGKYQPVTVHHSWNSPHLGSSAMMLNAPRHSDHHIHPTRHFPALDLSKAMPVLPYSLPIMAVIALWPPLWRRVMDSRVDKIEKR
jgi:alkane 1-monooxygenase